MKIILIFCFSALCFIPILAMGEKYPIPSTNQTIIVVKPNNTITVQAPNNTKLNELVQELSNNEAKLVKGNVLISSSTIVGFFGFGSFVAIRLRGSNVDRQGALMQMVYVSSCAVIVSHLTIIYSVVVLNQVDSGWYTIIIAITMAAVGVIASSMIEITELHVRDAKLEARTTDRLHMVAERQRRLRQERIAKENIETIKNLIEENKEKRSPI